MNKANQTETIVEIGGTRYLSLTYKDGFGKDPGVAGQLARIAKGEVRLA